MFRQLFGRGTRLVYLTMLVLTLSSVALVAAPGPASAEEYSPHDSHCEQTGDPRVCHYPVTQYYVTRTETTVESCTIPPSRRKGTLEVTTHTMYNVLQYDRVVWTYVPGDADTEGTWVIVSSEAVFEELLHYQWETRTDCEYTNGRPPKP